MKRYDFLMIRVVIHYGLVIFFTQSILISAPVPTRPFTPAPKFTPRPSTFKPATQPAVFAITPSASPISAVSTTDLKAKLAPYQQRITAFSKTTTPNEFKNAITDFLKDIVNPVLTQSDFTLSNLNDVMTLVGRAISNLASLNNQLISVKDSEKQRFAMTRSLLELKTKSSNLGRKYQKQKIFMNLLQDGRRIAIDQFEQKVAKYAGLVAQIDSELLEETKLEFVKDLELMAVYAKGKGGNERVLLDKLINTARANPAFSFKQQQQLAGVYDAKPQFDAAQGIQAPAALAGVSGDAFFGKKYTEVLAKPTMIEKIAGAKELLALTTAATVQPDKNTLMKFCETLFNAHVLMNKNELKELGVLLKEALENPFLLTRPAEKSIFAQWTDRISQALMLAEDRLLLESLKAKMQNEKQDYPVALQAALYAIKILESKFLKKNELNKREKGGLLYLLRMQLSSYYNNRADKKVEDLKNLKTLFDLAKLKPDLNEVIKPAWVNTLTVAIGLKDIIA